MPRPSPSPSAARGLSTAWAITTTMVAGIVVWGGIGLLVDSLVWSKYVFTAVGVVVGAAASIYIVYLRWGRGEQ
jgi:F0F1-type ATP synthase assembly protein I